MAKVASDNRKFRRYDVDSVHGKMAYISDINILNISLDGAAIATTQRLAIDREYAINLRYGDCSLTVRGKIVWSVLSHSRTLENGEVVPVYKAGVKFTNVLTNEANDLITYIRKSRISDREKRILGVRFKVQQPDDAAINMPCEYEIRRISLSGMLISSETAHEIDSEHDMEINLNGTSITVVGRIANCAEVKAADTVKYNIGVAFIRIPDQELKILASYIDTIGRL